MKYRLFLLIIGITISLELNAQEARKKIYFLADTINVSKNNRVLQIETISFHEYSFIFHCRCAPPYKSYVSFHYLINKEKPNSRISVKKPNFKFISYKELMDIAGQHHRFFDDNYDLYITEVLPGNNYRTNKVKYNIYPEPTQTSVNIVKQ